MQDSPVQFPVQQGVAIHVVNAVEHALAQTPCHNNWVMRTHQFDLNTEQPANKVLQMHQLIN
jgi:hypothetical protein